MSWDCKPVWAAGMGAYRHGYGLRFSNPHPTRTRDAGTAGFVHEAAGFVHKCYIYLLNGYSVLHSNANGRPSYCTVPVELIHKKKKLITKKNPHLSEQQPTYHI